MNRKGVVVYVALETGGRVLELEPPFLAEACLRFRKFDACATRHKSRALVLSNLSRFEGSVATVEIPIGVLDTLYEVADVGFELV